MTGQFSMDDLAKLLQTAQKKPRKKKELTEEQTTKMKERLAMMREKSLEARKKKADSKPQPVVLPVAGKTPIPSLEIKRLSEKDHDELFEKKYNSKFEKIDETMGHIKTSLEEMKELKKQKALERQKAKEEKVETKVENNKPIEIVETSKHSTPIVSNPNKVPKMPDYKNMFKKYPF
jgi:hypothetical protein